MDEGKAYAVTVEVPGADKDGLEVLPGPVPGTIVVQAKVTEEHKGNGRMLLRERRVRGPGARYARVIPVAWDVDAENAKTTLENGILRVVLPKRAPPGTGDAHAKGKSTG